MYDNIGGKIKGLAKGTFIVEAIAAIIIGIAMMADGDEDLMIAGALTLICGPIVAWVSSWMLYAFGQIVEDVRAIRNKEGTTDEAKAKAEAEAEAEKMAKCGATEKNLMVDIIKKRTYAWDHWNDEYSSIGQCEQCGTQFQQRLFVEFEDSNGKHKRNICYCCFCKLDCKPVEDK